MKMNEKAKAAVERVMEAIKSGDFPQAMARASFTIAPITRWSWFNRIICVLSGTCDARGFNQWKKSGRSVKKGSKAIFILAPVRKKVPKLDDSNEPLCDDENDSGYKEILTGFRPVPVFRAEDTEGEPLDYEIGVRDLPLSRIAELWGIEVKGMPGGGAYGSFRTDGSEIKIASPDVEVFLHELCHAAHKRVKDRRGEKMRGGQQVETELVAEIGAMVLCRLYGFQAADEGEMFHYLSHYAGGEERVHEACLGVLGDVFAVMEEFILAADSVGIAVAAQ